MHSNKLYKCLFYHLSKYKFNVTTELYSRRQIVEFSIGKLSSVGSNRWSFGV